jgi:dCTP diphosphatase
MSNLNLVEQLRQFVDEREWSQFHTAENLAKSISIESAELLECFQWNQDVDLARVHEELGDVLTYCILLADKLNRDIESLVLDKLEMTKTKYPVEKSRGRSTKYTDL